MKPTNDTASFVVLIAVAIAAVLFHLLAFYPGALNFDSAYQWWQARGHETSNIHGIGMTGLWRLSDLVTQGPGLLFVLQLAFLWCGLVLVAVSLPVRAVWRTAFVLAVAASPIVFVLFSAVESDAMLAGLLCCALGICVRRARLGAMLASFALVIALLLLAVLVRKNAALAVLPLLALAVHQQWSIARQPLRGALVVSVFGVALCGANLLLERAVDRPVTVFAATAMWDLAAISIDTGEMLLPASTYEQGLEVDEIRRAFEPYANASIFEGTKHGLMQPFFDPDASLNGDVRRAWLAAVFDHPKAYLQHRWRVTRGLFGTKDQAWPRELVYFSSNVQYGDNPAVAENTSGLHAWFMRRLDTFRSAQIFAAWPYVLLAVVAGFVAWPRRNLPLAEAALAAAASGLLYAAPLPLIAPSVELRYLGWTCLSALLAAGLAFAVRGEREQTG